MNTRIDDCQLKGKIQHGGEFHNWIVFTGSDGHVVTYDLPKGLYEFQTEVEPLHTDTRYEYKLFSDHTWLDGTYEPDCTWAQRVEDGGRTLRCEDYDGDSPDADFQDLVIFLQPGYGTWNVTGDDTGWIQIPVVCGEPEPPAPIDPPVGNKPPAANNNQGNCPPGGPSDGSKCGSTTVLSRWTGYYTHSWDRSKIRSVSVVGGDEPRLRVEFNPHMCDMDTLAASVCLCTSTTAAGNPITAFKGVTVDRPSTYVLDITVRGDVLQGGPSTFADPPFNACPEGTTLINGVCEWNKVEKNIIPECVTFSCCPTSDCEDGAPDGNIDIGDGDGDGNGDCDKRPTPIPVPGTNDKNQVYLYDKLNHTFVFCCPILADVTWLLPYDTMPSAFQRYVSAAASVRAAAQLIDNPQLFQLLKDRENTLRMICQNYELEQGDYNFLNQPDHSTYLSYQTMQTLNR